jgi:hypothetical protein
MLASVVFHIGIDGQSSTVSRKDMNSCSSQVSIDEPSSKDVDNVKNDTSSDISHTVGSVVTDGNDEYQEEKVS